MKIRMILTVSVIVVLLSACSRPPALEQSASIEQTSSLAPESNSQPTLESSESMEPDAPPTGYVTQLADQIIAELVTDEMGRFEQVQAAYEYVISNTVFAEPIGLDAWQYRGESQYPPSYAENRALSPLAFGIGSCEDYAAALVILLQRMGFEAEYVPGLTISVAGGFVDHAWAVVCINGTWYHLDPQLEDNILKNASLTYRFFLKSDEVMYIDHRWGSNLIASAKLTEKQRQEITSFYSPAKCPTSYPTPATKKIDKITAPNRQELLAKLSAEKQQYEQQNGRLPKVQLNTTPPVFGYQGYGDPRY